MTEKMKPCPFCGSHNLRVQCREDWESRGKKLYATVSCMNEGCYASVSWCFNLDYFDKKNNRVFRDETIRTWNTRYKRS